MKLLFGLFFLLNILVLNFLAQAPPPPAPLIYSAPEKSLLKDYVSPDKSFQLTFAGAPQVSEKQTETQTFTTYLTYRAGSNSFVTVVEYTSVIDEEKRDKIYESVKNNYLKDPKTKLEAEKEISANGIAGKEFSFLQDYHYLRLRIIVSGKRVYGIASDVTNWHILTKYNTEKVKEFNDETDRFFNSFKLLK